MVVEINPDGITGQNLSWIIAVDHARLFRQAGLRRSGRRRAINPNIFRTIEWFSTIRTYKLARTYQNVAFTYTATSESAIGECLAFNQTIGSRGRKPSESGDAEIYLLLPEAP